jgi:tetratricopeptide (TPR) repeat protein
MNRFLTIALFASLLLPLTALAEIKTVTHSLKQPFGGSQSPDDARTAGIARAKREALEQFGTYIESTTVVKNAQVDSDEILALTAGVTKAEVIKQKNYTDGDAFGIEITVNVELDSAVLENSLNRLLEDRNHLKDLKAAREREKMLLTRIVELEKQNQQKGKTKQQSAKLKKGFTAASQGLTAVEWYDRAVTLWDGKKYSDPKKVIEYLTETIRLDPSFAIAYNNRGPAYADLKRFDLAIADFDQAIRLDPNEAITYYNRGHAYHELKQFVRAITDYDQAIRLDPNDASAYNNRGSAYSDLKQFNRAIVDYDQAIRLDPNKANTYNNRGYAYLKSNQSQNGCADFTKACKLGECRPYEITRQGKLCR